jgi:hypothetical protein
MSLKKWLVPAAAALALGVAALPAQSAPVGTVDGLRITMTGNGGVEQAHYRYRHYRHHHHYWYWRHHRRHHRHGY